MDTISSRDSYNNYLPLAGVIAGVLAIILAGIAFFKVGSLNKEIADLKALSGRVDAIEQQTAQVGNVSQVATDAKNYAVSIAKGANDTFKQVSDELGLIKGRLDKVEAGRPVRVASATPTAGGAPAAAAVAGADEYIVKAGDNSGTKIAAANGVSLPALMAVNPDVVWTKLHIGQKLKLPKK